MKRRGFLGILAGLLVIGRAKAAESTHSKAIVPPDGQELYMAKYQFHEVHAVEVVPLPFREPDPALFALQDQIRRDLDAEYHATHLLGKDGDPSRYLTSNTAWYLKEPEASQIPRFYRDPRTATEVELRMLTTHFRFPPRRCGPVKRSFFT